ncbi:MAG TPA: PEP-CTERM sorting domain-containing protein [Opitutaceae bacterium]|nr:PEP-CTERM sorting domain-containing protein [Opitutaceae bacterium]
MKRFFPILVSIVFVSLTAERSFAQVSYDFRGTISTSNSSVYHVGDSLELTFNLASQIPASQSSPFPGFTQYQFTVLSATMTVNGNTVSLPYSNPTQTPVFTDAFTTAVFPEFGFGDQEANTGLSNPSEYEFSLNSRSAADVNSYMLPLPGLPVSDFAEHFIKAYDSSGNGGEAQITSYSVTGLSIPEPSTYAAIAGAFALGAAIISKRKKALDARPDKAG